MARSTPEQARIRIIFSGIPGVTEQELAVDVEQDTEEHHNAAIAAAFDQAAAGLKANRLAALGDETVPTPAPAKKKPAAKKKGRR